LLAARADRSATAHDVEVARPDEPLEREADRAADDVLAERPTALPATDRATRGRSTPGELLAWGAGRSLDRAELAYFEAGFGQDFGDVRLHDGAEAAESAASLDARAYTLGSDIVLAAGEEAGATAAGRRLLAHELAHVVQQRHDPAIARVQREILPNDPYPGTVDGEQPGMLGLSDEGFEFLKKHEGVRLKLYNDSQGHCTIGVGHLVHKGNCDGSEPENFKRGLTEDEVDALFRSDLDAYESAVGNAITSRVNQYQFDALVSFTFNVGIGAFKSSGVLKEMNAKNYSKVPAELMKWVKPPEITGRRTDETNLFKSGKY
jgi:GH24 family phage-related lysozyme (muramidase)